MKTVAFLKTKLYGQMIILTLIEKQKQKQTNKQIQALKIAKFEFKETNTTA